MNREEYSIYIIDEFYFIYCFVYKINIYHIALATIHPGEGAVIILGIKNTFGRGAFYSHVINSTIDKIAIQCTPRNLVIHLFVYFIDDNTIIENVDPVGLPVPG